MDKIKKGDGSIDYMDYLAEHLDKNIKYTEYVAENLNNHITGSESTFENNSVDCLKTIFQLISGITYNDFTAMTNVERLEFTRSLKINKILNDDE